MADNLKDLKVYKNQVLDPTGGPESVTVENHNELEERIINSLGRFTGFPFIAKNSVPIGVSLPVGSFYWDSNSMNTITPFTVFFTAKSVDGYLTTPLTEILTTGSILKYKDFVGRAAIFSINSISNLIDDGGNAYIGLNITGYSENPNYTFGTSESEPAFLEFFIKQKTELTGYVLFSKGYQSGVRNSGNTKEVNDICTNFLPDGTFGFFQYNGGDADMDSSYTPVINSIVNV